jgi:serine/threonine-protein kinase
VDHRADIFSAGVIFYEMLTHQRPFAGPSEAIVHRVCNEQERKPSEIVPTLSPCFDAVVARALAKDPAARYQSAAAFADAIRQVHESVFSATPSADVSENTIMMTSVLIQEPKRVTGSSLPGTQSSPSIWRDETLRTVERHLAAFIGPVARLHVRNASTRTTDFGQLCVLLAENLDTDAARHTFLSETRRLAPATGSGPVSRPAATPGVTTRPTSGPPSGPLSGAQLAPGVVERAARILAHYIGPIANVLARKAAAVATDERHLYSLLSAHLSGSDRDAYLKQIPPRQL